MTKNSDGNSTAAPEPAYIPCNASLDEAAKILQRVWEDLTKSRILEP